MEVYYKKGDLYNPPTLVTISARFLASHIRLCLMPEKVLNTTHKNSAGLKSRLRRTLSFQRKSAKKSIYQPINSNLIPSSILEMIWQEVSQLNQGIYPDEVYCFLNESRIELDLRHCIVPSKTNKERRQSDHLKHKCNMTTLLNHIPQYSPNLCHLNLSYLRNLPPDFSFLAQLLRLESLKFDYSDLDCTRLESLTISLASLHNLKLLSLRGCPIEDGYGLGNLCSTLRELKVLDLQETLLNSWNFLGNAQHFQLLEHELLVNGLSIYFRSFGFDYTDNLPVYCNEHVQYYQDSPNQHLLIHHLNIVFPHLVKLELDQIIVNSQVLESIRLLPNLKELRLLARSTTEDLFSLMDSCGSRLELLHLSGFRNLVCLDTLALLCSNLKKLRLEHCRFRRVDDRVIVSSYHRTSYNQQPRWSKLEHLELKDVPVDSIDWPLLVPASLKRAALCLIDNVDIEHHFLDRLPASKIEYLALIGVHHLTVESVENLMTRFHRSNNSHIKLVIIDSIDKEIVPYQTDLQQLALANCIQFFLQ